VTSERAALLADMDTDADAGSGWSSTPAHLDICKPGLENAGAGTAGRQQADVAVESRPWVGMHGWYY